MIYCVSISSAPDITSRIICLRICSFTHIGLCRLVSLSVHLNMKMTIYLYTYMSTWFSTANDKNMSYVSFRWVFCTREFYLLHYYLYDISSIPKTTEIPYQQSEMATYAHRPPVTNVIHTHPISDKAELKNSETCLWRPPNGMLLCLLELI